MNAQAILIVDDEQDMLQLLKRSLEPELNCRVDTAASGRDGAANDDDEIPTTWCWPTSRCRAWTGLELLERIKRDRARI